MEGRSCADAAEDMPRTLHPRRSLGRADAHPRRELALPGSPSLANIRAYASSGLCRPPLPPGLPGECRATRPAGSGMLPCGPGAGVGLGLAAPPPAQLAEVAARSLAPLSAVSPLPVSPALELTV